MTRYKVDFDGVMDRLEELDEAMRNGQIPALLPGKQDARVIALPEPQVK